MRLETGSERRGQDPSVARKVLCTIGFREGAPSGRQASPSFLKRFSNALSGNRSSFTDPA
jgi:hypothetical protein